MDAARFDFFVRSVNHALPRRGALVGAIGAGLTSLLRRFGGDIAEARKRKKRKKCKDGKKRCGKKCLDLQTDPLNCGSCGNRCDDDMECHDGVCVCPAGTAECGDTCVDLRSDADNCGACGTVCNSGGCVNGACTCSGNAECPETCTCSARLEGGGACREDFSVTTCDTDDDCPLGSFCPFGTLKCTTPCLG